MELKQLKNEILVALLQGALTESDLTALSSISKIAKAQGVDVIVKLPDESTPVKKASVHAIEYARRFVRGDQTESDVNDLALKMDLFFADTTYPRISEKKIHNIRMCREMTGLCLADAKWVVENAFGL